MFVDNTEIKETLRYLAENGEISEAERIGCEERMDIASFNNSVLEIYTPSR